MSKVLITTSSFDLGNFHDAKALQDRGISIEKNPHGRRLTENEVAELTSHGVIALLAGLESERGREGKGGNPGWPRKN